MLSTVDVTRTIQIWDTDDVPDDVWNEVLQKDNVAWIAFVPYYYMSQGVPWLGKLGYWIDYDVTGGVVRAIYR